MNIQPTPAPQFLKTNTSRAAHCIQLQNFLTIACNDIVLKHATQNDECTAIHRFYDLVFTQAGQKEWKDVLEATILDIEPTMLGLELTLGGISPQRLHAFAQVVGCWCSKEDYLHYICC